MDRGAAISVVIVLIILDLLIGVSSFMIWGWHGIFWFCVAHVIIIIAGLSGD